MKNGQNIKLVSLITGYTVDAMSVDEYSGTDNSVSPDFEKIADSKDLSVKVKLLLADNNILKFSDCVKNEKQVAYN